MNKSCTVAGPGGNASDGSQLLTTGLMNFEDKTYNCLVRFLN